MLCYRDSTFEARARVAERRVALAQTRNLLILAFDLPPRRVKQARNVPLQVLASLAQARVLVHQRSTSRLALAQFQVQSTDRSRARRFRPARALARVQIAVQHVFVLAVVSRALVRHRRRHRAAGRAGARVTFCRVGVASRVAMAPKPAAADVHVKPTLQAVVLADSFATAFKPLTEKTPKALVPLGHVPMLEYTLEWLSSQGVEETYVLACAHAEMIDQYLKSAGWGEGDAGDKETKPGQRRRMTTKCVPSASCVSAGEALRLIDHKHVIRSDFVLVSGDVVTNIDLKDALERHRARRKKEKLAVMTVCLRNVGASVRESRYGDSNLTIAMDAETNKIVHYEEHGSGHSATKLPPTSLDASLFGEVKNIRVRTDLMDCHVDICAPEFLMLFTDNFDYQHIRRDFIVGTLNERELGNTIYGYEISRYDYAARVHNLRSYDAVSRDILNRWTFPYVPDTRVVPVQDPQTFTHTWGNNYLSPDCEVHESAKLTKGCSIGAGTVIGAGTSVSHSVIGKNVIIGQNCVISGAYIFDGARIENESSVTSAILQEAVVVHAYAHVTAGCVLAADVVIGSGFSVKPNTRISLKAQPAIEDDDYDSDDSEQSTSLGLGELELVRDEVLGEHTMEQIAEALAAVKARAGADTSAIWAPTSVGAGGAGYVWAPREESWFRNIAQPKAREPYDCSHEYATEEAKRESAPDSRAAAVAESDSDEQEDVKREGVFQREVAETFLRCVKQGYAQENAVVELQGLKMAENRTFADIARYVLMTIVGLTLPAHGKTSRENVKLYPATAPSGTPELLKRLRERLKEWAPLLSRFLRSEDDQVEALLTLEEFCSEDEVFKGMGGAVCVPSFAKILHMLYDMDVIGEESVLAWAEEKAEADEADKKFLRLAQPFIDWLEEASSEEESSSEDD